MRHWLIGLLLLPALACAGTADLREADLHRAYGVTQRWDNVEQSPTWVAGVKPQKHFSAKLHELRLSPGQWVEVQLSANALLRLHSLAVDTAQPPLQFEISSGSGLYIRQQPQNLPNGDLILDAHSATPWLARISLGADAGQDVIFSLFSSRPIELPAIEPYRYREASGAANEQVRYANDVGAQLFEHIAGSTATELSVEGPVRYQLQQRLLLTDNDRGPRNYQLHYQLDGGIVQVVDAAISTARHRQLLLNGEPIAASHLRNDYIDIPAGQHRLRLQFSEDVLLRILKSKPKDYLFPDLNAPMYHDQVVSLPEPWSLTPQQLLDTLQPESPLQTVQQSIMRIIVDNRRQGGGLVGPMALMAIARKQPDMPALLTEAQVLLKRHSYYDDLPPTSTHGENRHARFAVRRLRTAQDNADHYLLSTAERSQLAYSTATAWFTTMSKGNEVSFNLPERPADSLLRLVILDHPSPAELQLFMDDRPPLQLRLDNTTLTNPARYAVDAASALSAQALHSTSDNTWQLAVQQTHPAAALELHLPRGVKRIRILRSNGQQPPLSLALQYRVARPYRLSDASYINLLNVLRKASALQPLLRACLMNIDTALDPGTRLPDELLVEKPLSENVRSAARAVLNHWVPLLRWLRARQESYRGGINNNRQAALHTLTSNEVNAILASAKAAERASHWLLALESWQRLAASQQPQHRQAALSGKLRALLKLGEYPLAERLLRGSYLNDIASTLQQQRFDQARALYRRQNNHIALEGLLATALARAPDRDRLSELAGQLINSGRLQDALTVGMLLPPGHRPHSKLLAVAVNQQAWRVFQLLLADVTDESERDLWLGYRAQALGAPEDAERHWQAADGVAKPLLQSNRERQQLVTVLLHGDEQQRTRARQRLADWLPQLPGPRHWQAATTLAHGDAGMAWLYSPSLGLGFNTLHARPGQPVQLRVAGPVRLRFDIQPLHDNDQDLPLDGWLRLQDNGQEWISPFTGNRVSTTLVRPGSRQRPGRIERRELQLPAGMHQLEISGIDQELLLRLYVEAPLLDLGLSRPATLPPAPGWRQLARGVSCSRSRQNIFVDCQTGNVSKPVVAPSKQHAIKMENLTIALPDKERSQWQRTRPAQLQPLVRMQTERHTPSDPWTSYQDMVTLLWHLEKSGADADTVIARMEAQASAVKEQPQATFVRPLLKRATRGAEWQAIEYVPESAGVRYVERPANAPESPTLRVRAALLGSQCGNSRLLSGHDELVYSLFNLQPVTLRLELMPCSLPYQLSTPMQVQITRNGKTDMPVSLPGASVGRSLKIHTQRGEQVIRLRILDPVINRFLGVRIHDPSMPRQDSSERVYHLATHDEPVRFDIEGPAWLRVDELRRDRSFARYIAVDAGWQSLQLSPADHRVEALYRLYRRSAGTPPPAARLYRADSSTTPVPAPFRVPFPGTASATINDDYPLGDQEDGTLSMGLRLVSRTRVDDEEQSQRARFRENFSELRGEYRYFDADNKRYWRSEILGRLREDGDPVLGFGQHLYNWPMQRWPRVQTSTHLTGFIQRPGDELPGRSGGTEWTVNANARALLHIPITPRNYHEPSLTVFGRAMSMNRNDRYAGNALDRDVFSRYKAQHKRGLRLSEYLLHKPWIDTEWYSQLSVTSNEDFNIANLDNLETRIGWRQLMGAVDVDAGYRLRHYLSDDDRNNSSTRNDLRLNMRWTRWNRLQRRGEVRLFLNYDIDNNESSAFLGLFLHGGNGRGLRDFRRSEMRFANIRQRNAPHSANRVSP